MAARLNSTNTTGASMQQIAELHVHYLGKGSVRTAWKVDFGSGIGTAVVLKKFKRVGAETIMLGYYCFGSDLMCLTARGLVYLYRLPLISFEWITACV